MAERRSPALDLHYRTDPDTPLLHELLYAELDAFEPLAVHDHETGDGWRVFFRTPGQRDAALARLAEAFGMQLSGVSPVDVDDEDWARRSQAELTAVRAGRLLVAPPWDPAATQVHSQPPTSHARRAAFGEIVIVIDPSMGFGTGHHATTRLCLELLQELELHGRRVVDVGTGSGVLALAAWKLGASDVVALDNDPDALQNARENAALNAATGALQIREADLGTLELLRAHVVLANLTAATLVRYAEHLRALAEPGGHLLVSGFGPGEIAEVVTALGGRVETQRCDGEWCAVVMRSAYP